MDNVIDTGANDAQVKYGHSVCFVESTRQTAVVGGGLINEIPYKLVMVKWADSYGCSPVWAEIPAGPPTPHYCFSAGWLVRESEDAIVIVPHISPKNREIGAEESGCGEMTIPRRAILWINAWS